MFDIWYFSFSLFSLSHTGRRRRRGAHINITSVGLHGMLTAHGEKIEFFHRWQLTVLFVLLFYIIPVILKCKEERETKVSRGKTHTQHEILNQKCAFLARQQCARADIVGKSEEKKVYDENADDSDMRNTSCWIYVVSLALENIYFKFPSILVFIFIRHTSTLSLRSERELNRRKNI